MTDFDYAAIDEMLASRVRLAIVAFLAGAKTADFAAVRDATKTTDGNASIHLRRLEDAGYVAMQKRFVARRPQTLYSLTERGRKALLDYLSHLEALLSLDGGGAPSQPGKNQ
jgi:DNA-binding MarR family transcriptional regulator